MENRCFSGFNIKSNCGAYGVCTAPNMRCLGKYFNMFSNWLPEVRFLKQELNKK